MNLNHGFLFHAHLNEVEEDNKMIRPLYIFSILSVRGEAPNSTKIEFDKGYKFMPFGGSEIYTIDEDIWLNIQGMPTLSFFPTLSKCNMFFDEGLNSNITVLIALTDKPQVEIPGRGLVLLQPYTKSLDSNLVDIGYDVTDLFGLSSITNIGYSMDEFSSIVDLDIGITEYGLISNKSDALKFTKFSDNHILEHSPFLPLRIKLYTPSMTQSLL